MRVAVVGAGIVGVSCALALQRRGLHVTLIDRLAPGSETSHGNAGVLSPSSLIPFNNPALWRQLPALLRGRNPGFRYNVPYLIRQLSWASQYVWHARKLPFAQTRVALNALIGHSRHIHQQWLTQAGQSHRLRDDGWLFLYRSEAAWQAAAWTRSIYAQHEVSFENLDPADLHGLEPALSPVFAKAVWLSGAASVDDPGAVVRAYARLFVDAGGTLVQAQVNGLQRTSAGQWAVQDGSSPRHEFDQVVLALGPFSQAFLQRERLMRLPMAFERGSHMHYAPGPVSLRRPVYDTAGGYVLSPMAQGWRLTTGVELNALQAPVSETALDLAEKHAREALPLGKRLDANAWHGSRPTLPDSRPMIGACPDQPGLWLALGHQHIGFSTGPASGELLSCLMTGEVPFMDSAPFSPSRFQAGTG